MYFMAMVKVVYPKAFSVPIWILSSSTILVMVVRHTRAATRKKNSGKVVARDPSLSASFPKDP